jgi:hypothetical protein
LIMSDNPEDGKYCVSAIAEDSSFALVYIPYGTVTKVNTQKLPKKLSASWFNPRDNTSIPIGNFDNAGEKEFTPQSVGQGSDWVLIIKRAS